VPFWHRDLLSLAQQVKQGNILSLDNQDHATSLIDANFEAIVDLDKEAFTCFICGFSVTSKQRLRSKFPCYLVDHVPN
jgi:hypothetical protein